MQDDPLEDETEKQQSKNSDVDAGGSSQDTDDTRGITDDRLFDDELSIEQISEATKWPALQKSRPEDYAEEFLTASHHRQRSRNPPVLSIAICGVVTFCIVWLACVILLLRYG